jgi:adenylylsulfate kinase
MSDTRARSAVKSASWRLLASATTTALVFAFTGRLDLAVTLGGVELVLKLLVFYAHERAWNAVEWGKAS